MPLPFTSEERFGYCRVAVVPGGNNAPALGYVNILGADVVFAADAPNELKRSLPNPLPLNIVALTSDVPSNQKETLHGDRRNHQRQQPEPKR